MYGSGGGGCCMCVWYPRFFLGWVLGFWSPLVSFLEFWNSKELTSCSKDDKLLLSSLIISESNSDNVGMEQERKKPIIKLRH